MNNEKTYFDFCKGLDDTARSQIESAMEEESVISAALMPDAHGGYTVPIGSVIVTEDTIYPSFVGNDIGCGVAMYELSAPHLDNLQAVRDAIVKYVPVGDAGHQLKVEDLNSEEQIVFEKFDAQYKDVFLRHLGTLGGGNHFIELGVNPETNKIYLTIHTGSRGVGGAIAKQWMTYALESHFVDTDKYWIEAFNKFEADNGWKDHNPEKWHERRNEFVQKYMDKLVKSAKVEGFYPLKFSKYVKSKAVYYTYDMDAAIDFARLNRARIARSVLKAICEVTNEQYDIKIITDTPHNYAEVHVEGDHIFVKHRKGANPAGKGQLVAIPANMRDGVYLCEGRGSHMFLESCSHGAGRTMTRTKAREQLDMYEVTNKLGSSVVNNHTEQTVDELPECYKDIDSVMSQQSPSVKILFSVLPILNIKG